MCAHACLALNSIEVLNLLYQSGWILGKDHLGSFLSYPWELGGFYSLMNWLKVVFVYWTVEKEDAQKIENKYYGVGAGVATELG